MAKAKKVEGLDCEATADAGVGRVLLARFEEMAEYGEAALDFADVEGVHDMRVASRRLRSALRDFAPHVWRPSRLERVRGALKELAGALGGVRDEDVAIAALARLAEAAPAEARAGIEALAEERHGRRESRRRRLAEALGTEAVEKLRSRFARAVEEACRPPRSKKGGAVESQESFAGVGRAVVARSWAELRELSPSLYRPLKQRRLHRMRIAAKRLRYALELFTACWGGAAHDLASEISDLQDALGELHDCDEWIAEIGERLARRGGDSAGGADLEKRTGLVWLLDHFAAERARSYREALRIWHGWEREDFAARIAACAEGERPAG